MPLPSRSLTTVLLYTSISLLLLFLLLSSPRSPSSHSRRHRRLKLRPVLTPSSPHAPIPFDPIISDIQSRHDDRHWERSHFRFDDGHAPGFEPQPEWEDFADAEDYINDEHRFNVTRRIQSLFPQIDLGPADGHVTSDELAAWNLNQATREVMRRTEREMEVHDKNKDGLVEFSEYEPPSWALTYVNDHNNGSTEIGWWRGDHFNASDLDGDGMLNLTEFNDFLHPADSTNPKLVHWLCKEEIRERDKDKDGKLNFQEFFNGLFDSLQNYDEVHNSSDIEETTTAKKLFQDLDKDKDGFLSEEELKPVIGTIHPSEYYYAKQQADYVISQADTDNDGRLSLKEMIEHPYVFYSSIFTDDDEDNFHDEFR